MKNIPVILVLCSIINVYGQNVKVSDYKVPVSEAKALRFDGNWNWSQTGNNVNANNANANLLFRTFYSSLPLAWLINVDAAGGKRFGIYNHNVRFEGRFSKYIWDEHDWFGFTRLIAEHADFYKQISSDLTVGFGYGRYINATALAKAVRIEDHFIKDKVVPANFPKETMINIAHIIERESEYRDLYGDTYETYWFNDIEEEMLKPGIIEEEYIGSLGILRMRQVLFGINERVNQRYYGWDATLGILFPITNWDKSTPGNPNLTVSGRYSFPISWKTQINSTAEAFTPIDSSFFKEGRIRTGLDFIYELSNRINFVAGYRLGLFKLPAGKNIVEQNLNTSFWYYIENNIYLTISGDFLKQGSNPSTLSTRVGLQYNLF